jgi:GAF domain-containing protein
MTTYRPDTTAGAADGIRAASDLTTLARALAETSGLMPTLRQVATRALDLVPCDWAAVAVADHFTAHRARLSDSTDEALMAAVADIAGRAGTSPGIVALHATDPVVCNNLDRECRFPDYAREMVARTPVRAVLSVPLRMNEAPLGVLTLYSRASGAFDPEAVDRAVLVAEHAAIAIEAARTDDRAEHLELALRNSRTIGAAIGILVERHRIRTDEAFERLRGISQHSNRKLVDVAQELVDTGALPECH